MQLRSRQRGISLLESMIAIVLVALGVLGILGVQLRTLADTQTAVRRAQAIRLIEDLSERLKANPAALAPGVLSRYEVDWGDVSGAVPNCTNGCGPGDMARADIAQWKQTVASTMPLGDARVSIVTDTSSSSTNTRAQLAVMVSWRENERQRDGATAAQTAAYKTPLSTPAVGTGAGTATVSCPENRSCHLQYLQPTLRCLPYSAAASSSPVVACP
jgi:type IV pilus assembly protein PilV